jgi:tRNA(Ile)-lysidine synthase
MYEQSLAELTRLRAATPTDARWWLAFSGGADSLALASLAADVWTDDPERVTLVHINHGLHADAEDWAVQCHGMAAQLGLELRVIEVSVSASGGIEAAAREARYAALRGCVEQGDLLFTAHHMEDQAETVLLRLMRGAGVDGLAGMVACRRFADAWLHRPLLAYGRAQLDTYVASLGIAPIHDPANDDERYDRVYLRNIILPQLRQRWPAATRLLARAAAHQRDASVLLSERAQHLLNRARGTRAGTVSRQKLQSMPRREAQLLLRYWLAEHGANVPSNEQLSELWRQLTRAQTCAERFGDIEVRTYRDQVYAVPPQPRSLGLPQTWTLSNSLQLVHGTLSAERVVGRGLDAAQLQDDAIEVSTRVLGEQCEFGAARQHRPLKKMFQHWGIPPWERASRPVLRIGGDIAAVPGIMTCPRYAAAPSTPGWWFSWEPL